MFTLVSQQDYFYILLSHKESSPSSMSLFSYQSCVYSRQSFESGPWLIKCLYVPRRYTKKKPRNNAFKVCNWCLLCVCEECEYPCTSVCLRSVCLCAVAYVFTHMHIHLCICEHAGVPYFPPQLCV